MSAPKSTITIILEEKEYKLLKELSDQTGKTIEELIRETVFNFIAKETASNSIEEEELALLEEIYGTPENKD